ncbi:MAG: hypothetical protein HIU91_12635 [Acidobacteria bacterium]|nr:hypothetical protein [Acidobacteriota bacterium]
MKKVVLASLLAVAGAVPASPMFALQAAQPAAGQAGGSGVTMSQAEYAAYNNANTQTTAAGKAAAFEAYLKAYPNSAVKQDVLSQILFADSQTGDQAATLNAADRLLAVDPNNLRALTFEVYYRRADADKLTDPAAKLAALDKVAQYAQQGLNATAPKDMPPADFDKLKAATAPTFESAIADDDLAKKDNAAAIAEIKKEIAADPADTEKASPVLQDVYVLAQTYYTMTPPDYLDCAWYATRAAAFAPAAYKPTIQPLATYCYNKYHGNSDGYQVMQTAVQSQLNPPPVCGAAGAAAGTTPAATTDAAGATPAAGAAPAAAAPAAGGTTACLAVTPAPKPEDIIKNLFATTPDLAALAISDREFVLQYGTPDDAQKVFDAVKGKAVELPGVTVIAATPDALQVAVSDDAVQGKTADFTFNMKEPLKTLPTVGDKITLDGTYASFTQSPLMITMSDGAVVAPKKAAAPVHHTAHRTH